MQVDFTDSYSRESYLTSVHESGHAVSAWAHGGRLLSLELTGNGEGRCMYLHPGLNFLKNNDPSDPVVLDGILCALAGCAAQARMQLQLSNLGFAPDGYFWDTAGARQDCVGTMAKLHLIDSRCGVIRLTVEEFYAQYGGPARAWVWHAPGPVWECIQRVARTLLQTPPTTNEFGFSGPRVMTGREAVQVILQIWAGDLPALALPLHEHGDNHEQEGEQRC